ncbi:uncharacterized protein CELE_F56A8.3 [Caenorhabditis elegans]|uniref:Transmembrane protein n=1 Tax=Caenorhabditis elegans TaxID=6239 RepID=O45574_CAEEL|nr:Transmembrane protein [Caenorhabditis elegans]CAB05743.1 Transmembrane protein [Caenorhabditis elegans]|eukprot:NP_499731.1 Uncharacterized protein CELE_F56A8.3 [Caenorhabditis elegans]
MAKKDAKQQRETVNAASHKNNHSQQPKSQKKEPHPKKNEQKKTEQPRGFFRKLFGFVWSCVFYLTIVVATSSTVAIALDCKGLGSPIPGTAPLCKDLTLMATGNKPSAAFVKNTRAAYGSVLQGYHNQVKPHVAPVQAAVSKKWKQFAKSDVGGKVEKIAMNIHAWIVDKWVKIQRFVQQTWNNVAAWWKKNGQKQFGPALEGFVLGVKMVFQVVADALRSVGALLVHFFARAKTFFVAFADGGFNAAMNTLNH